MHAVCVKNINRVTRKKLFKASGVVWKAITSNNNRVIVKIKPPWIKVSSYL